MGGGVPGALLASLCASERWGGGLVSLQLLHSLSSCPHLRKWGWRLPSAAHFPFPQLACECYALLPSLGAGFAQGLKYRESWEQQAHSLVATLHRLLGTLYEGAEAGEWARVIKTFRLFLPSEAELARSSAICPQR